MLTQDSNQVIVTMARDAHRMSRTPRVRHRAFPEIRGEGESARESVEILLNKMLLARDTSWPGDWRHEKIERAIEDLRAYLETLPEPDEAAHC